MTLAPEARTRAAVALKQLEELVADHPGGSRQEDITRAVATALEELRAVAPPHAARTLASLRRAAGMLFGPRWREHCGDLGATRLFLLADCEMLRVILGIRSER